MAESLNRDMYAQLVRGIADSRHKTEAEVRQLLDEGPFLPEDALRAGLVDDLAYEDQLDDRVRQLKPAGGEARRIESSDYQRVSGSSVGIRPRSRIAVIYAVGVIASGRSGYDPVNGPVTGSETLVEQIRRARADSSLKAIVLRVDSPGGSSIASDVIWRELMITRDQQPSRPLVASMSDLAASGGYYIAMPAQVIVAQPATLTGSIGIYTGKVVTGGTMNKLGVTFEEVKSGRNADINSPFEPFSPAHRAKLQDYLQGFYDHFVERVAESRHTTPERIDRRGAGPRLDGAAGARGRARRRARRSRGGGRHRETAREASGRRGRGARDLSAAPKLLRGAGGTVRWRVGRPDGVLRRRRPPCACGADGAGAPVQARRAPGADAVCLYQVMARVSGLGSCAPPYVGRVVRPGSGPHLKMRPTYERDAA
jgi:signal peptide peptidase SppA